MSDNTAVAPPPPSRAALKPLKECRTIGEALATQQFQRAVADAAPAQMTAQRLMATFRQAARNNPAFDQCNLMSVLGVFMTCTFLGLEPNTPLGHAYMIPFKRRKFDRGSRQWVDDGYDLQLIIGYQGYLDLAYRNPRVSSIAAHVVFPGDDFSFEYGSGQHLQHRPRGMQPEGASPQYAYMFAKLTAGEAFEVLPYSRIIQIRNGSQGYQAALAAKERAEKEGRKPPAAWTEAPWVKHFDAMAMKTAVRHGYKWLPKTVEMAALTRIEEAQDRGLIDFGPVLEGHVNPLDEDLPMLNEGGVDPGAAFGERDAAESDGGDGQQRNGPQRQGPQANQQPVATTPTSSAAPAAANAKTEPTGAKAPVFEAWLADASGEVAEHHGIAGQFLDPIAYAHAYAILWRAATPEQRLALGEHNADGIQDAYSASQQAMAVFDALNSPDATAAPARDATPRAIQVLTVDGKPDLRGYLAALRESADHQTAATVDAWAAAQRQVIAGLSAVTRRNAERIVADRRTALGVDKPEPQQQPQAQDAPDEPPPPTGEGDGGAAAPTEESAQPAAQTPGWSEDAMRVVEMLDMCTSRDAVEVLSGNEAVKRRMARIETADPEEFRRLRAYAIATRERFPLPKAGG